MRQLGCGNNGRVGDIDAMMQLVLLLQAAQDGDGRLDRRFAHQHLLETSLQGCILLDVLAVFIQRGGTHAMQFAARQCRLEHIAGVHRTLGLARTHHGVNLVDKDDGLAFILGQLFQH